MKIKWEFNDAISSLRLRFWYFTSNDGSLTESLASISRNDSTNIETRLFEVDIERPATLVLKNVNQSYNGVYQFALIASTGSSTSDVTVFIASKFFIKTSKHLMSLIIYYNTDLTVAFMDMRGQPISMTKSYI